MNLEDELEDIDFEEQKNEEPNQEHKVQNPSIDREIAIDYYKKNIHSLSNKINKIKEKLSHYRKVQLQFSLLLNKTIEHQFGPFNEAEAPIQKPAVPPLPPIHKESRTEIIRLIHSSTPSEVHSYFQKSNIISIMLFSDTSVFDKRLKESLIHTSPDIQVSFFNSTFLEVKKSGEFVDKMTPFLSHFSTDPLLCSQIVNSNSNFKDFYRNCYLKFLKMISDLAHFPVVKIIYTTSDLSSLIYPTEDYSHIINISNSLSSNFLKKKVVKMNSPQKNPSFEIVSEGPLFDDYSNVLSVKFSLSSPNIPAGAVIILSDEKFKDIDETRLSIIVSYLSPLLKLFRSLFFRISPCHFSNLSKSISSLRASDSVLPSFPDHICSMCDASLCRLLLVKPNKYFPEIQTVNLEQPSLIANSINSKKSFSYINARKHPEFNKNVDDYPNLPKISSMLISPIKGNNFVFVLYNSSNSTEFTPIQKSIANSISLSLEPLLHQIELKRKIESTAEKGNKDKLFFEKTIEIMPMMIKNCLEGNLFNYLHTILSPFSSSCLLFIKISDNEAMRFPGCDLVEISDNLNLSSFFSVTNKYDINIDVAGDSSVKKILIANSSVYTVIVTTSKEEFEEDELEFCKNIACVVLMLGSYVYLENSFKQCKESHQLLRNSLRMSPESFSKLICSKVELLFFDPPLQNDPDIDGVPLIVSIETQRGIEGALAAYDTSREAKAAVISYAEWLTSALSNKNSVDIAKEELNKFVKLFIECGVLEVFKCNKDELKEWILRILRLLPRLNIESVHFVADLMNDEPWPSWFNQQQKLLIVLCAFLNGIDKNWECQADKNTVKKLKNVRPENCPVIAAVFGTGFGIGDKIDEEESLKLISQMQAFLLGQSTSQMSLLLSNIRSISLHGFKISDANRKWMGKALASLVRVYPFTLDSKDIIKRITNCFGEERIKTELFIMERIFLPVVSFISAKNERFKKMDLSIRESIVEARKQLH